MSSTDLVTMIDSIEAPATTGRSIPQAIMNAEAVGGYNGGNGWPTYPIYKAVRPDLPGGHVVSIVLRPQHFGRCFDVEDHGGLNGEAPGWFRSNADTSHGLPWLYTFASNVQPLVNTMTAAGIPRDRYYIWAAHFTFRAHICAPGVCGFPKADGTQYTDAVAGNCDGSLIPRFMLSSSPPIPGGTVSITSNVNENTHSEVFVHLSNGEVKNLYKVLDDKTGTTGWKRNSDGTFAWESLGTPGK